MAVDPRMLKALLGETKKVRRVGLSPTGGQPDFLDKIEPHIKALAKRYEKDRAEKARRAALEREAPGTMKSWSSPDMFGFGGGYSRKTDIDPFGGWN
tara:strand:- start:34 stop:324 length:291 start_codon:yes stop_codon:yes gene_type:complete